MSKLENSTFIFDVETDEILDFSEKKLSSAALLIKSNTNVSIRIDNINALNELNIKVEENATAAIRFSLNDNKVDAIIRALVFDEGSLTISMVDFSSSDIKFSSNIILLGYHASATWNLSSLSFNENVKKYNISFNHIGEKTNSLMNNYGVCADKSTLYFDGVSHIEKMAINSVANQKAKIIVYDEGCKAKADPILKIDNREVQANHAAAVGTLNDMHVFYLLSRGINLKDTRNLITLGYLKPIFTNFKEDEVKDLEALLEEKI